MDRPLRASRRGSRRGTAPRYRPLMLETLDERRVLALTVELSSNIVAENAAGALIGNLSVNDTSEPVLVHYSARVATATGTPFGFTTAEVMGQIVNGFFRYDRTTADIQPAPDRGGYPHTDGGGGFRADFLGLTVGGSPNPFLEVENLTSDTFRFIDGPRVLGPEGDVMSVNGVLNPAVELWIAFTDGGGTAFSSDALPNPLPYAVAPLNLHTPFWFPHTFSLKDGGGTLLLQLETLDMGVAPPTTFSYVVSDNRFEIANGNELRLKAGQSLNYEVGANVALSITALGSNGQIKHQDFSISVTDVNEAPTAVTLASLNVSENAPGATIGNINVVDPDAGSTFTYLFSDPRFEANGNQLKLKTGVVLNFESETSIPLTITARDAGGLSIAKAFSLNVLNVNEAPHDMILSRSTVFANLPGAWVADLTTMDVDAGDTHAYVVSDARFTVIAGGLYLKAGQTIPAGPANIAITVNVRDHGGTGLSFGKGVNLTVLATPVNWVRPYQWALRPADINADGSVFATDAALIINAINAGLALGPVVPVGTARPFFFDASGDGIINPSDAAEVINYINAGGGGEASTSEANGTFLAPTADDVARSASDDISPTFLWPLTDETANDTTLPGEFETADLAALVWTLEFLAAPQGPYPLATTPAINHGDDRDDFEAWWLSLWLDDEEADSEPTAA